MMWRVTVGFFAFFWLAGATHALERARDPVLADRIVAVVNNDIITLNELHRRLDEVLVQLKKQGTPLPPRDVLERQMLDRMVMDKIQTQHAAEIGIHIDETQLDQAIARIATNNNLSMPQFREALERDKVPFSSFREDIRNEMTIARVREREVDSKIDISESEIENYLQERARQSGSIEEYELAHILLRSPESASPEQIAKLKSRAEEIHARANRGENFSQLAIAHSDAPDGLRGGELGARSLDRLPGIFAEVVVKLNAGETAPLLRSPNGFHIVKLIAKRGGTSAPAVQQTNARHILIKVNEIVSDSEARHKLEGLYERILHGGNFAELARLYSQDGSATQGGDLGWLYPGDTVPEFERAMDALKPGEVSRPVKSPFGYHLIEVLGRRLQEASQDRQRNAARQALRERRFDEAYQDWLRQARDRAYVESRLDDDGI